MLVDATMVMQALACPGRLEQKTMEALRIVLPLGFCRLQKYPLQKASHAGIINGSNVLTTRPTLRFAVLLPRYIRRGPLSLA